MKEWYFYLHSEGKLIGKNPVTYTESQKMYIEQDFNESPFVLKHWKVNLEDRQDLWIMFIEALSSGADIEQMKELAKKWHMDKLDMMEFIQRHVPKGNSQIDGLNLFIKEILGEKDINKFWEDLRKENMN